MTHPIHQLLQNQTQKPLETLEQKAIILVPPGCSLMVSVPALSHLLIGARYCKITESGAVQPLAQGNITVQVIPVSPSILQQIDSTLSQ